MSPVPENITPQLVHRLELAADRAFNNLVMDILRVEDEVYDYPVAAFALDETANMRLGEGFSRDFRDNDPESHAELNALKHADTSPFEAAIVVTTMESCVMCQQGITHQLGHGGLIAYVTSRSLSEDLGHVNRRPTTHSDSVEGVRSLQLLHPRLQTKGSLLLREHVARDRETRRTIVSRRLALPSRFAQINRQYPLDSTLEGSEPLIRS